MTLLVADVSCCLRTSSFQLTESFLSLFFICFSSLSIPHFCSSSQSSPILPYFSLSSDWKIISQSRELEGKETSSGLTDSASFLSKRFPSLGFLHLFISYYLPFTPFLSFLLPSFPIAFNERSAVMNMFSGENLWPEYDVTDFGTTATVPSFAGTEVHALPSQEGSFILSLDEATSSAATASAGQSNPSDTYR